MLAIAIWPIITLGGYSVFNVLLSPVFSLLYRLKLEKSVGFGAADALQAAVLAGTQFAAVAVSKWLFHLCGATPTQWIALPFGLLCAVFVIPSITDFLRCHGYERLVHHPVYPWAEDSLGKARFERDVQRLGRTPEREAALAMLRLEKHTHLSWVIGLPAGLTLATLWMLCDQNTVGNAVPWLFWIGIALAVWYALREMITVASGVAQDGMVMPGQRACHLTVVGICILGIGLGFYLNAWWPPFAGIATSVVFRELIRASGRQQKPEDTE